MTAIDVSSREVIAARRILELRAKAGLPTEWRDPSAATRKLSWSSPGLPMVSEWDAEQAVRLAYLANVIVYRCVQIRANTIASLPFRAGATPSKPDDYDENAPLARLLGPPPGGPAPKLSARRLWAWTVAQRIVTGRHGWEIETAQGSTTPVALWPLVSSFLDAVPTTGGAEWFSSFRYGSGGDKRKLDAGQVVYGWNPSLVDFRQPESELQAARLDISIAVMADRYNVAFLKNDARPAAVVVTEAFAKDEEFQAFKQQWRSEYGGVGNAGKTAFLEASGDGDKGVSGAIDIKVLGLTQKDAQLIEMHKASLERIAIALKVPWSKLDASGRTFDNATEEDHAWWESSILPDLADFADEVNMQLAPRLGREVGWFDTSSVRALQAPRKVQAVGAPALLTGRIATLNEARAMVDLPPTPDGDRFLTDEEIAVLAGRVLPLDNPTTPVIEPPKEPAALPPANADRTPPTPKRETRHVEDVEVRRTRLWKAADAVAKSLETQFERRMRKLFERQQRATLDRIEGKRGRQALERRDPAEPIDPAAVFDPDFWEGETADTASDLYEAVVASAGGRIAGQFGIDFDLSAPYVQDFIQARSNKLAGQVTTTTYDAIRTALAEGVAAGESIPDIAARVRHVFDVASSSRATTIARTEVISAYNGSALAVGAALPADVVGGQEWIATRDGRVRAEHADADGQVVAMGAQFSVGGEFLAYPGDPGGSADNTVNCRCTIALLTPDEMEGRSAPAVERRVAVHLARAVVAMVRPGEPLDELGIRRALREAA